MGSGEWRARVGSRCRRCRCRCRRRCSWRCGRCRLRRCRRCSCRCRRCSFPGGNARCERPNLADRSVPRKVQPSIVNGCEQISTFRAVSRQPCVLVALFGLALRLAGLKQRDLAVASVVVPAIVALEKKFFQHADHRFFFFAGARCDQALCGLQVGRDGLFGRVVLADQPGIGGVFHEGKMGRRLGVVTDVMLVIVHGERRLIRPVPRSGPALSP